MLHVDLSELCTFALATSRMEEEDLNQLLSKIEHGKIPLHLFLNRIFELVVALNDKIDGLDKKLESFPQFADIKKQIEEIHKLHFATKHLQKVQPLKDKYLAEILIGKLKKRQ